MSGCPDNRHYLFWLALGTASMALVSAVLLVLQLNQRQVIRQSSALQMDSVSGLTFEFDREFLRFRQTLDRAVNGRIAPDRDELMLRYDIFVSRLQLLRDSPSTASLLERPEYLRAVPHIVLLLQRAEGVLLKTPTRAQELAVLLDDFNALGPQVQALSASANAQVSHLVEQQGATLLAQKDKIIGLILAQLLLLSVAAVALWLRQCRQEEERLALEQLTRELRVATSQAQSANRSKSQFLASMSHELRTPFNGILGMLDLLDGTALTAQQTDYTQTVRSSANHLLTLIQDILDISALDAHKVSIQPKPLVLSDLLADIQRLMRPLMQAKQLVFVQNLATDLPQQVLLDATRVKQILFNLINNAVKFTLQGSITLTLRCQTLSQGCGGLSFIVEDTGIGIGEEVLPHLFDRFYQVDAGLNRTVGGAGLGLEISRSLARLMGGDITVSSVLGRGSAFTLYLPVVLCAAPALVPVAAASASGPRRALLAQVELKVSASNVMPRVLVVEDHPVNSKFIGALLTRIGCTAAFCENGQRALDKVQQEPFDLIVMDVHMPVMDGLSATRAIRALSGPVARIPIIVLTADTMNEARESAFAAGASDFLNKPVQVAQFRLTLQKHLS